MINFGELRSKTMAYQMPTLDNNEDFEVSIINADDTMDHMEVNGELDEYDNEFSDHMDTGFNISDDVVFF